MCAHNNFNKYTLIDFEQDFSVLLMHVYTYHYTYTQMLRSIAEVSANNHIRKRMIESNHK